MKPYIDFKTDNRKDAKNEFEQAFVFSNFCCVFAHLVLQQACKLEFGGGVGESGEVRNAWAASLDNHALKVLRRCSSPPPAAPCERSSSAGRLRVARLATPGASQVGGKLGCLEVGRIDDDVGLDGAIMMIVMFYDADCVGDDVHYDDRDFFMMLMRTITMIMNIKVKMMMIEDTVEFKRTHPEFILSIVCKS